MLILSSNRSDRIRGMGYTTEAATVLIDKSFAETAIAKIVAWALVENRGSTRVMEKAGLKLQQEHLFTANLLRDSSLLTNSLVQNLLDRPVVRYQLKPTV